MRRRTWSRRDRTGCMQKRRLYLAICAVAVLTLIGIFAFKAVQGYFIASLKPRELPHELIRRCFREITDRELPSETDDLKALFHGGVDPAIFVRFRTNSDGINFICNSFVKSETTIKVVDPNWMRALTEGGGHIFYIPFQWEQRVGIRVFDQERIESAKVLEYLGPPGTGGYKILIDNKRNVVYIHAFRL
jgi:hypothetical protein